MRFVKVAAFLAVLIVIFFSSCTYLSSKGNSAYQSTKLGDSKSSVITRFDLPYVEKASGEPFVRFDSKGCRSPCQERLWFESRLSFGIEAWSVDFDQEGRVIDKYHWTSP